MNKELMRSVGFAKEVELVENSRCPMCSKEVRKGSFRDALSEREFTISGLCQSCQDSVFMEID